MSIRRGGGDGVEVSWRHGAMSGSDEGIDCSASSAMGRIHHLLLFSVFFFFFHLLPFCQPALSLPFGFVLYIPNYSQYFTPLDNNEPSLHE